MALVSYTRVSTHLQTADNQQIVINDKFKIDKQFSDTCSGSVQASKRDGLKALLAYVREHDTVVIISIDRIGRNVIDILTTIEILKSKNVNLVSIREGIDINTPAGMMMVQVMASVAELEKGILLERQKAGINRAKQEGKVLGRPKKICINTVLEMRCTMKIKDIAKNLDCAESTIKNMLSKHKQ